MSFSVLKLSFSVVGSVFEFRLSALCLQPFELVTDTLLFGLRILFFFGWSAAFPIALNWGLIRSTNGNAYTHYGEVKNLALPGSDEEGFISYKDLYNLQPVFAYILSFAKRLTIAKQSAIIIVLVSEFSRGLNAVIRVFTVSFTQFGWMALFCFRTNCIYNWAQTSSLSRLLVFVIYQGGKPVTKERSMYYAKTMSGQLSQHVWHL